MNESWQGCPACFELRGRFNAALARTDSYGICCRLQKEVKPSTAELRHLTRARGAAIHFNQPVERPLLATDEVDRYWRTPWPPPTATAVAAAPAAAASAAVLSDGTTSQWSASAWFENRLAMAVTLFPSMPSRPTLLPRLASSPGVSISTLVYSVVKYIWS